jgi:hypothetical protein
LQRRSIAGTWNTRIDRYRCRQRAARRHAIAVQVGQSVVAGPTTSEVSNKPEQAAMARIASMGWCRVKMVSAAAAKAHRRHLPVFAHPQNFAGLEVSLWSMIVAGAPLRTPSIAVWGRVYRRHPGDMTTRPGGTGCQTSMDPPDVLAAFAIPAAARSSSRSMHPGRRPRSRLRANVHW